MSAAYLQLIINSADERWGKVGKQSRASKLEFRVKNNNNNNNDNLVEATEKKKVPSGTSCHLSVILMSIL